MRPRDDTKVSLRHYYLLLGESGLVEEGCTSLTSVYPVSKCVSKTRAQSTRWCGNT